MAIPSFLDVMLPILTTVSDRSVHSWRDLRDECAKVFDATDDELAEKLPSLDFHRGDVPVLLVTAL